MPIREECKHFQSRTYSSGEAARFCVLDLAPEAPWRCPENCPKYERRLADAGWVHGTLVESPIEDEPETPKEDVTHLLDEAGDIVDAILPGALADIEREQSKKNGKWRKRFPRFKRE